MFTSRMSGGVARGCVFGAAMLSISLWTGAAAAQAPPSGINSGDTAWMLTSMVLVLFMTLPGLALFYGGLVRTKRSHCVY